MVQDLKLPGSDYQIGDIFYSEIHKRYYVLAEAVKNEKNTYDLKFLESIENGEYIDTPVRKYEVYNIQEFKNITENSSNDSVVYKALKCGNSCFCILSYFVVYEFKDGQIYYPELPGISKDIKSDLVRTGNVGTVEFTENLQKLLETVQVTIKNNL